MKKTILLLLFTAILYQTSRACSDGCLICGNNSQCKVCDSTSLYKL